MSVKKILAAQSAVIVLVSVNRLSPFTHGFAAANQFLRWVELVNLLLSLAGAVLTFLLLRAVRPAANRWLDLAYGVGVWLYAAGYGDHETTNYLHERFCPTTTTDLCRIVAYHDDTFAHLLFFAGFIVLALVVMVAQATAPDPHPLTAADHVSVVANGLLVAAGVVANLAFEPLGLDLYVVAVVAVVAVALLVRHPGQLVLRYYALAFAVGLLSTMVIRAL